MTRLLIGGVGYRNLRDHSVGVVLVDELAARAWLSGVAVEDVSYNPIAFVQRLQDPPPAERFELIALVGARQRPGRAPGTLAVYRWDRRLPSAEDVQAAVTEAVTGVIALENTVVVAGQFDALPPLVVVLEIEPDAHEFGEELTPAVSRARDRAREILTKLAFDPAAAREMPEGPLDAGRAHRSGVIIAKVQHVAPGIH